MSDVVCLVKVTATGCSLFINSVAIPKLGSTPRGLRCMVCRVSLANRVPFECKFGVKVSENDWYVGRWETVTEIKTPLFYETTYKRTR